LYGSFGTSGRGPLLTGHPFIAASSFAIISFVLKSPETAKINPPGW
jgi:hypothetical protein